MKPLPRGHLFVGGLCLICGTSREFHHNTARWRKRRPPRFDPFEYLEVTAIGDRDRRFLPGKSSCE